MISGLVEDQEGRVHKQSPRQSYPHPPACKHSSVIPKSLLPDIAKNRGTSNNVCFMSCIDHINKQH